MMRAEPAPDDICDNCGHAVRHHIYHAGACRPGFVCGSACERVVVEGQSVIIDCDDNDAWQKALLLTNEEWANLASICQLALNHHGIVHDERELAYKIMEASKEGAGQ